MRRHGTDNRLRRGMTLIEAVISIVIVATMLVAAVSSLGSFARARRSQFDRCAGGTLARGLMSEILQARYLEPGVDVWFGRDTGEAADVRTAWDDVDDYNGLSECPPATKSGAAIAGAAGWTRKVTVEYVQPTNPNQTSSTDTGLVRITVSATSPTGVTTTLQALRSDESIYDQPPRTATTFVSWVAAEMQIGSDQTRRLTTGTHVLDQISVP
jgi:MSHA pilin protein MshD